VRSRWSAACACVALASGVLAADAPAQEVRTLAGSGSIGFTDGPAASASFATPSDIARSKDGTIYISDEAAQNIRAIEPSGSVRTVAGSPGLDGAMSVIGGYRDGPASTALFNHPLGLAFGPDGGLYIADSRNACIRELRRGIVSTVIGVPGATAAVDGPRATARLSSPRALAFDTQGRLWIADFGAGLRRMDPDGRLTTVPLPAGSDLRLTSLSIAPDKDDPVILAITPRVLFQYRLIDGEVSMTDLLLPPEGQARPFGISDAYSRHW